MSKGVPPRVWLTYHRDTLVGLGILAGFAVILGLILIVFLKRNGPDEIVDGVIRGFGVRESDFGTFTVMTVQSGTTFHTMDVPSATGCRIGDTVEFRRVPHWWGYHAVVGRTQLQECARAPFPQQ